MNKYLAKGTVVKDAEITTSGDLKIARFTLAINRGKDKDGNDKGADFPQFTAFNKRADFAERFVKKGQQFLIESHYKSDSYEKDGKKIYTNSFIVDNFEFCGGSKVEEKKEEKKSDDFMEMTDLDLDELPWA